MAKDPLAEAGLYFDEVSGLQILDPDVRQKSLDLKEECKIFIDGKLFQTMLIYQSSYANHAVQLKAHVDSSEMHIRSFDGGSPDLQT